MPFSKKPSTRFSVPPNKQQKSALGQFSSHPFLVVGVLLIIPLVVLLAFTFKSGFTPTGKKKYDRIITVKTPTEIADEATAALQKNDTDLFLDIMDHEMGSNINMQNSKGDTLLIVAATLGNAEAVKQLILAGADVNRKNAFTKDTALLRNLYYSDNTEIAKLLVYSGADINARNNYNHTPLYLALEKERGELIDLFLTSGVHEGLNSDYLFRAAAKKNYMGVLAMLKGGIDPNVSNEKGNTPLIISSSLGDLPSVKVLLAYRADVNAANKDGNTPLIYAARYRHPEVVRELLRPQTMQVPVDVNAQNKDGQTALYWAAAKGYDDIVRRLLAEDADPTIAAKDGLIPYKVAEKNRRTKVLPWFSKDLTEVKNSVIEEDNAAMIAKAKAEGRDITLPEEEKPVEDADIFKAAEKGDIELARRVLAQNRAVVFDKNKAGQTPLLVAVANGHIEMVDYLLDNASRLFEASSKGNVFHVAVTSQNMDMLKHLVEAARMEGRLAMMLEYKAVPAGKKQPMTPLAFAALACNKEMYDYLVSVGAKPGVKSTGSNIMGYVSPVDLMSQCKTKVGKAKKLK